MVSHLLFSFRVTTLFALLIGLSWPAFSQNQPISCATDEAHTKRLTTDSLYRQFVQSAQPAQDKSADDSTTLYTIPVVFVIYHLGEAVGTGSNVSESALQLQIDLMNRMFAGQRPDYVGPNANIRFVLARRSLACGAFNGIARVDARSVPGYQSAGLDWSDGTKAQQLRNLLPEFSGTPTDEFVTIRVMHQVTGAGGWAYYGGDIYVSAGSMTNSGTYSSLLTHEMGHSLFLNHTFSGSGELTSNSFTCPTNANPETDGDYVADTDPHRKNEPTNGCDALSETLINTCTGQAFGLIGRNFMSYGCNLKVFTRGQVRRMRSYLTGDLRRLITSSYLNPPVEGDIKAACVPTVVRPNTVYRKGIAKVQFQHISKQTTTDPYQQGHYQNYTCSDRATVTAGQSYSLIVAGFGRYRRAYIDYNNDGTFDENTELVWASENGTAGLITIPTTAAVDRQLRLRVIIDDGTTPPTACNLPGHPTEGSGETEDYAVRILPADTPLSLSLGPISGYLCQGQATLVSIINMGTFGPSNTFTVQLSDASGGFDNPVTIGSATVGPIGVELPPSISLGNPHKVRVVSSSPVFTSASSPFLVIGQVATATMSGSQTPVSGTVTATLSFSLTGTKPWTFAFNKNGTNWGGFGGMNTSPFSFTFVPTSSGVYELSRVSNACGEGITTAGSTTILVPCSAPTGLDESRYSLNVIRTTWPFAWGNTYTLQWKETTATTWNSFTNVTSPGWLVSGLDYGKTYVWRLKMHCIDGESDWSAERSVTMNCPEPLSLNETVGTTTAQLAWSSWGSGASYTVRWRSQGATTWTEVPTVTATGYSLTSLTGTTAYEWQVRTNCPGGEASAYSPLRQFSTTCPPPPIYGTSNISASMATANWNSTSGLRYQVRWKPVSSSSWTVSDTTTLYAYANLRGLTNNIHYEWQVRTVCSVSQTSAWSGSSAFYTDCSTPTQLYVYEMTASTARFSWYGASNIPYELRYRVVGSSSWTTMPASVGTYYSLTGLTAGITYECQVRAVCSASVSSGYSNSLYITPNCLIVPLSTMSESNVTPSSVQFRWQTSAQTRYMVRWRAVGATSWQTSETTTVGSSSSGAYYFYTANGLTAGATHEWQVQAFCDGGSTSMSGSRTFIATCQVPTQSGVGFNLQTATLYFSPSSGLVKQIRWRAVGSSSWTESLTTTNSYYAINNLDYGLTYEWQVRSVCSTSEMSPYSGSSTFTLPCWMTSGGQTYAVRSTSAQLNWSSGGNTFELRWRPVGATNWTMVPSLTTTTYSLTGLTTGIAYEWQVRTFCSTTLASDYTYPLSFTTACPLARNLYENAIGGTSARLSWSADFGTLYVLQWRGSGSADWSSSGTLANGSPDPLTGLTAGTAYEWRVLTDCDGTLTPSASRTFTADCGPPARSSMYTYDLSSGAISMSWNGTFGLSGITYQVRYRPVGTSTWIESITLLYSSTAIRGLINNTTYEWQVQRLCDGIGGGYSVSGPPFTTTCLTPTAYMSTPGDNSAYVYWSGSSSELYSLDYRVKDAPNWITINSLTTTSYSLSLTPGTAYEYRVRTACADGTFSTVSNMVSFTTLPVCDPNEPNNTAQTATPVAGASFTLTGLCLNRPYDTDWYRWTFGEETYYVVVTGNYGSSVGAYELIGQVANGVLTVATRSANGSVTDTYLNLYAADGRTYRSSNNDANNTVFSQIPYTLPAPCGQMSTVRNGNWTDASTWSCNRIPISTDTVQVQHTVMVPYGTTGQAKGVTYGAGGKLTMNTGARLMLGQ